MKTNLPMPVIAGVIIIIVLGLGLYFWKTASVSATSDVKSVVTDMNQGKPATDQVPQSLATQGVATRGMKGSQR